MDSQSCLCRIRSK